MVVEDTSEIEESPRENIEIDPPQEIIQPQMEGVLAPQTKGLTLVRKSPTPVQPRRSTRSNRGVRPD